MGSCYLTGGGIGGALATAMAEPQSQANQQTALRLAANSFQQPPLRQWVAAQASGLLDGFNGCLRSGNKAVRLGVATFLLNCAVLGGERSRMLSVPQTSGNKTYCAGWSTMLCARTTAAGASLHRLATCACGRFLPAGGLVAQPLRQASANIMLVVTVVLACADAELKIQVLSGLSEVLSSSPEAEAPETLYRCALTPGFADL